MEGLEQPPAVFSMAYALGLGHFTGLAAVLALVSQRSWCLCRQFAGHGLKAPRMVRYGQVRKGPTESMKISDLEPAGRYPAYDDPKIWCGVKAAFHQQALDSEKWVISMYPLGPLSLNLMTPEMFRTLNATSVSKSLPQNRETKLVAQ